MLHIVFIHFCDNYFEIICIQIYFGKDITEFLQYLKLHLFQECNAWKVISEVHIFCTTVYLLSLGANVNTDGCRSLTWDPSFTSKNQ